MIKRLLSLLLALVTVFSLAAPAYAEEGETAAWVEGTEAIPALEPEGPADTEAPESYEEPISIGLPFYTEGDEAPTEAPEGTEAGAVTEPEEAADLDQVLPLPADNVLSESELLYISGDGIAPLATVVPTERNVSISSINWSLTTIDGKTITKSTYAGKVVLMVFYRASMSGNVGKCANSNGLISQLANSSWISSSDVQVIAIDVDANTAANVKAYKAIYAPNCSDIVFTCGSTGGLSTSLRSAYGASSSYTLTFCAVIKSNTLCYAWDGASAGSAEACRAAVASVSDTQTSEEFTTLDEELKKVLAAGSYRQAEARSMLSLVNDLRTGSNAWYWNASDTEKVKVTGLKNLTYDYALEQIAMQRAAELAISYSHTRPDGTSCFDLEYNGVTSWAENIAYGYTSVQEMFDAWAEEYKSYSGQGHRRNMLSSNTSIGIACFYYNGRFYWAQEFGPTHSGVADPQPELAVSSGTLSGGLTWKLENSVLTISGKGAIGDMLYANHPWLTDSFTSVKIENGVTGIGNYVFLYCANLESVTIPASVTTIGSNAFYDCPSQMTIYAPYDSAAETYAVQSGYNFKGELHATPKLSSVSNVSNGVKLAWGAVSGAVKYRVFYKTGSGSWTTLADTASTSYTWTGAKPGTKYSFTVRCISADGKTYTSSYDTTGKSTTTPQAAKNGLVKDADGVLRYYTNGQLDTTKNGVAQLADKSSGSWYYVEKGVFAGKTGIAQRADGSNSNWYFVKNGVYTKATGIAQKADGSSTTWYYVENGLYVKKAGIAQKADGSSSAWYYVENGLYRKLTGIAQKADGSSSAWYYVENGLYRKLTGIAQKADGSSSAWYFVQDGQYVKKTGVAQKADGSNKAWYYVENGLYVKKTGLTQRADGSNKTWYYVQNGQYLKTYTGLAPRISDGKLFYVQNGAYLSTFSGNVTYNGMTYTVKNGAVV